MLEDMGEWFGGIVDSVSAGTQAIVDDWIGDYINDTESANPESNRQNSPDALEANGQPVQGSSLNDTGLWLRIGVVGLAVVGLLIAIWPSRR